MLHPRDRTRDREENTTPEGPYTEASLTEAAHTSRTLSEALRKLGVDPKGPARRRIRDRMRKLGVDTAHFEREGVRWTKEVLSEAVAASTNMCQVLRHLGLDVVGGHHTHISRRVRALGIDTSHFRLSSPAKRQQPRRTHEGAAGEAGGAGPAAGAG